MEGAVDYKFEIINMEPIRRGWAVVGWGFSGKQEKELWAPCGQKPSPSKAKNMIESAMIQCGFTPKKT
jgi:hypothetical protein